MKKPLLKLSIIFILALVTIPALGAGTPMREYMAPLHDSQWMASQEDDECLIQHDIPGLGNTKLRQGKGEPLSFELHITQDVSLGTQCDVQIGPPPWRHDIPIQSLGTINIVQGAEHIQAKGGAALKIYQGLEAGMMTSFNCSNKSSPLSNVKVVISPVRYLIALPDFQRCITSLASKKKPSTKPGKKPVTEATKTAKTKNK
jgi:hypothetical protein